MSKKSKKLKGTQFSSRLIKNAEEESDTICQALQKLFRKEPKLESIDVDELTKVYHELKKLLKRKPTADELVNVVGTGFRKRLLKL